MPLQNVVLISIASVMDASLAPAGKHTLHAYLPATEPFHYWEGELAESFCEPRYRVAQKPCVALRGA